MFWKDHAGCGLGMDCRGQGRLREAHREACGALRREKMVARTAAFTLEVVRSEPIPDTCWGNEVCVGCLFSRNICPSATIPTSTTLLGNRVLKEAIELRSQTGLGQSLNSTTGVLIGRERCEERCTQGRRLEGAAPIRGCQGLPAAVRCRKRQGRIFLGHPHRHVGLLTL